MNKITWIIPKKILNETEIALRSKPLEVFVFWTSSIHKTYPECKISRLIVPQQDAHNEWGHYVHIDGSELSRITFENYDNQERNVIQIHTHPSSNVNMSALDREWEVVTHVGALSIIVPNFCKNGLTNFQGVNIYEREENDWRLWKPDEIKKRMKVI